MLVDFAKALDAVLLSEGGYVNDKNDPGGATNYGIIQITYNGFRDRHGLPRRSVRLIEKAEVATIYKAQYWDAENDDALPAGLDYVAFDYGVNSGTARALHALARLPSGTTDQKIDWLCDERLAFLKSLRTWMFYGHGWSKRVTQVRALGHRMAGAAPLAVNATAKTETPPVPVHLTPAAPSAPKPSFSPFGWLASIFKPKPAQHGPNNGDIIMTTHNNANVLSILGAGGSLGSIGGMLIANADKFGPVFLYGSVAAIAGGLFCIIIQALLPVGTATEIESAATTVVIPTAEAFFPKATPTLEELKAGIIKAEGAAA